MFHYFKYSLLILLCLYKFDLISQANNVSIDLGFGHIIKHKKELLFDVPHLSNTLSVSWNKKVTGDKAWHHYWGMPELTWTYQTTFFGNSEVFGQGHSLLSGIQFDLLKKNNFSLQLNSSTGIGYLTKVYDPIENPTYNAVSAHWNNSTKLGIGLKWNFSQRWRLGMGFDLIHFSNGRTKSPNSGINVHTASLRLNYFLNNPEQPNSSLSNDEQPSDVLNKKWGLIFQSGLGWSQQKDIYGGPTYHVYCVDLLTYWRFVAFQRVIAGVTYEYNEALYAYQLQLFVDESDAHMSAKDVSIVLGDEFEFGSISIRVLLGHYLNVPSSHLGSSIYFKFGTYYRPKYLKYKFYRPFVGVQMKSHLAIAEYISINVGVEF